MPGGVAVRETCVACGFTIKGRAFRNMKGDGPWCRECYEKHLDKISIVCSICGRTIGSMQFECHHREAHGSAVPK